MSFAKALSEESPSIRASSHGRNAASFERANCWQPRRRSSGGAPLMSRSIAKGALILTIASAATGDRFFAKDIGELAS